MMSYCNYHSDNNGKRFKTRRVSDESEQVAEVLPSEVERGKPMGEFQIPQSAESNTESEVA